MGPASRSRRCPGCPPRPRRAWRAGGQWQAVETGLAAVTARMLALLPAPRVAALTEGPVTIDLDATDVEACGGKKRGVACNHQGQGVGRPHVAAWAETEVVLAADLGTGTDDSRATAADLLRRALAACRSGPGPGDGWRCAPTPAISPGSSPAPRTTSTPLPRESVVQSLRQPISVSVTAQDGVQHRGFIHRCPVAYIGS
jgi:hypothetical protein